MKKEYYRYVFVVLVYKNIEIIEQFFKSIADIDNKRCIVVNAYYDNATECLCKNLAKLYDADYLPISNVGYGEGNNRGIEYAQNHYLYDYIIISNSDIIVNDLSYLHKIGNGQFVVAPQIKQFNGKCQNPTIVRENIIYLKLMRIGFKHNNYFIVRLSQFISRIEREFFFFIVRLIHRDKWKVFAAHGAFIILTSSAVEKLIPLFHKEMFLYNEELYLAYNCKINQIPIFYVPQIQILHLEGASAGRDFRKLFSKYRDSFMIFDSILENEMRRKVREVV